MGLMVKVKFPDGIREVPGYYEIVDLDNPWRGSQGGGPTPYDIEGWLFRGVIGGDCAWVACQVPIRREPERVPEFVYDEYGYRMEIDR